MQFIRTELSFYTWNVLVQRWNALRLKSGSVFIKLFLFKVSLKLQILPTIREFQQKTIW